MLRDKPFNLRPSGHTAFHQLYQAVARLGAHNNVMGETLGGVAEKIAAESPASCQNPNYTALCGRHRWLHGGFHPHNGHMVVLPKRCNGRSRGGIACDNKHLKRETGAYFYNNRKNTITDFVERPRAVRTKGSVGKVHKAFSGQSANKMPQHAKTAYATVDDCDMSSWGLHKKRKPPNTSQRRCWRFYDKTDVLL